MREYQDATSVANRVRMLRAADNAKSFLIVEGAQDCNVYRLFACPTRCAVQWGHGRANALDAGRLLDKDGFAGFVVAMDQDHWIIDNAYPKDSFVVWTDGRDLESTLMFAGVAERVLSNYGDDKCLSEIQRDTGKDVFSHLVDWCATLGAMRWVISRGRLGLTCKDIDAFACVDVDSMLLSVDKLADAVINTAKAPLLMARPDLKRRLVNETGQLLQRVGQEKWLYCRGHDLCLALASGLRDTFGKVPLCQPLNAKLLEASVRSAYAWSDFERTVLHRRIRQWERQHAPWRVLVDRPNAVPADKEA